MTAELAVQTNPRAHPLHLVQQAQCSRFAALANQHHTCFRLVQNVRQLISRQPEIERSSDQSSFRRPDIHFQVLVRVLCENRDAVTFCSAKLGQHVRKAISPIVEFAVGEPRVLENNGFRIGVSPSSVSRYITQCCHLLTTCIGVSLLVVAPFVSKFLTQSMTDSVSYMTDPVSHYLLHGKV